VVLDPGFPGGADAAPPGALHLADRVLAVGVSRRADDEIQVAVEEYVLAIVTVLPHVLGPVPEHRVLDRSLAFATVHFDGSGDEPARPSNSVWNRNADV
jgi:hypothetical protein